MLQHRIRDTTGSNITVRALVTFEYVIIVLLSLAEVIQVCSPAQGRCATSSMPAFADTYAPSLCLKERLATVAAFEVVRKVTITIWSQWLIKINVKSLYQE